MLVEAVFHSSERISETSDHAVSRISMLFDSKREFVFELDSVAETVVDVDVRD